MLVLKEDENKRVEHLNALQSTLQELEQLLTATNKPYFGGMTCEELDAAADDDDDDDDDHVMI